MFIHPEGESLRLLFLFPQSQAPISKFFGSQSLIQFYLNIYGFAMEYYNLKDYDRILYHSLYF